MTNDNKKVIRAKLQIIQHELKAPKGQFNSFAKFNYRSCEDILEALKPLLAERKVVLTMSDEMINLGDRYYVKATAQIEDTETDGQLSASGCAREAETKKGMDDAQITGSASSYARKYALNGLFAIDDTKDADTQDNSKAPAKVAPSKKQQIVDLCQTIDPTVNVAKIPEFITETTQLDVKVAENLDEIINRLTAITKE